jgi:hypothetical protein
MLPQPRPGHDRTGPLGRLARLALLIVFAGSLYSIVDRQGSARFRNPHILTEPSAWFLHLMMLMVFLVLVVRCADADGGACLDRPGVGELLCSPGQSADGSPCIIGLHVLDAWERRRTGS